MFPGRQVLTTTYVNATESGINVFTGFTPGANKKYFIEAELSAQAIAVDNAVQLALLGPATGITRVAVKVITPTEATEEIESALALNAYSEQDAAMTTPSIYTLLAIVEVGATPGAGHIRVGAKALTAAANAVRIFPGSFMRWREDS